MGVSQIVIGTVVLAGLTGLLNVLASVRLARRGRGSPVVSEPFNSNTVNILVGITVLTVFAGYRGGLRRGEGTWSWRFT